MPIFFYFGDLVFGGTVYWVEDHRNNSSKVDDLAFGQNKFLLIVVYLSKSVRKIIINEYKT